MKKKFIAIIIALACVIGMMLYYRPYSMSEMLPENAVVRILYIYMGVKDGQAFSDSETFNEITNQERDEMAKVLAKYSYRRKWNTLFTDESLSDTGEHLMIIDIYENDESSNGIIAAGKNKCAVNGKNYILKNSENMVEEILGIVRK